MIHFLPITPSSTSQRHGLKKNYEKSTINEFGGQDLHEALIPQGSCRLGEVPSAEF